MNLPRLWPLVSAFALFACVETVPVAPVPMAPRPRPALPAPATRVETAKSAAARAYFAEVQQSLLSEGLLRTDGGAEDAPFDSRKLAENFIRIALFDEYTRSEGVLVRAEGASVVRKWVVPVRVAVRFGPSIPEERRATDLARIRSYLARLSQVTGHSIGLSEDRPNYWVHILSEDEREAMGPTLETELPGLSPSDTADVTAMPRSTYCVVYATSDGNSGRYTRAVAVIRAEHPDLLRLSCIHEEIAQGLGLSNDSPNVRPSIFNDDEEFALLTPQDELMLKMLYDPALRPGMTLQEAQPIVESLASTLLGEGS